MSVLEHKIDFAVLVTAANANPNGDPLNGNRPRENYDSCGEISDVISTGCQPNASSAPSSFA